MDVLTRCGVAEFIHLISSEANEICEQESKKTIAPEHIISALKVCLILSVNIGLPAHYAMQPAARL